MAYVGTPIDTTNQFQSLQGKRFSGDGSTTAFTLDIAPSSVFDIEVFVENVRQDPNSAYGISGTTLTFTGAPPSGTNNIYVVHQAKAVGTIDVPASGVVPASLASNIISGQTELATRPADTDEFLVSDAGTIKRVDYSLVKHGITEADQFRLTTAFTNDAQPISSNLERNDTSFSKIGTGMSESSGVFTFPSTGIYLIKYNITTILGGNGEDNKVNPLIEITTDNSSFSTAADSQESLADHGGGTTARASQELNIIFDVTNTSTHKVRFSVLVENIQTQTNASSTDNQTYFTFIRLGDT